MQPNRHGRLPAIPAARIPTLSKYFKTEKSQDETQNFSLLVIALLTAALGAFTSDFVPAGEDEINKQGKITQALEKRIAGAKSGDEVIPVYIWLTDIDQDEVLAETERRFGMSEEEAIQDVDLFSGIDLESMKDDEAADIMEEIGKKLEADPELKEKHTEYARRANEFIGLKRQISKERYTERNAAFLGRAGLSEKDLVFVSGFSPMIIAEITVEKVKALAGSDEVVYLNEFVNAEGKPCQSISLQVTGGYF